MSSREHKIITGVIAGRVASGTGVGCAETRTLKVSCLGVAVDSLDRELSSTGCAPYSEIFHFVFPKLTPEDDSKAYRNSPRRAKALTRRVKAWKKRDTKQMQLAATHLSSGDDCRKQ